MKPLLLAALGMILAPLGTPAGEPVPAPVIVTNSAGERLENPQIISFDGVSFQVAHEGGVAVVAWASMPEDLRRGYQYDPAKAERTRQGREIRRQVAVDEARADGDGQEFSEAEVAPEASPEATPLVIERDIRINDRIIMSTIGGARRDPADPAHQPDRNHVRAGIASNRKRSSASWVSTSPRTLLFSDGHGCDVYWVERVDPNRDRWSTTIQFEYAPNAASRPR